MITPLDIHNKVFTKVLWGYKMEEVDLYLDEIIREVETLFRESREMKENIARLEEEAVKSREISAMLEKTMILAQKVFDDETQRAQKESELILWEAGKKGEKLVSDAQKEAMDVRQRVERLRLYEKQLYLKHKGFLEFQLELLDGYKEREAVLTDRDLERLGGERDDDGADDADGVGEGREENRHRVPDMLFLRPESDQAPRGGGDEERPAAFPAERSGDGETEAGAARGATAERSGEAGAAADRSGDAEAAILPMETAAAGSEKERLAAERQEGDSMEQVILLAQKMEEALKALDTMYGTNEDGE
ncbi:MAG: DivIVA domain-containing protein [Peptococcaceae bacterium]|jgi:cell division initiation protein|nr:DivIVA domain-containing protein [Peptococcaceae bacterium]